MGHTAQGARTSVTELLRVPPGRVRLDRIGTRDTPGDVDDRRLWDEYRRCYEIAIERCNTDAAPWFVVPADRKWYRNWAVTSLLREHLERMDLRWPQADFDVEKERRRLVHGR
jgi:hypothetical protein